MDPIFTDRELDIMTVLWDAESGTASEVRARLADALAYNTVLTMLGILEEKGYVRHEEEGRAFRYFPTVARRKAKSSAASARRSSVDAAKSFPKPCVYISRMCVIGPMRRRALMIAWAVAVRVSALSKVMRLVA